MKPTVLGALLVSLLLLFVPESGEASGLGKFAQGGESKRKECNSKELAPSGTVYDVRASALVGVTHLPEIEDPLLSLYLDGGYRFFSTTTGCSSNRGMLSTKGWWWHSLSVGVETELVFAEFGSSTVAPMLAWEMRREKKGFLADIANLFPLAIGATVGPHLRGDQLGVGGALFLRGLFDFRVGARYDFDNQWSWSAHVGMVDPHILVYRIVTMD